MNVRYINTLWIALLLVLSPVSSFAEASLPAVCDQTVPYVPLASRYSEGVLFKIYQCNQIPSYFLGTMHSDDPDLKPIVDDALKLIANVDEVGFEFVENDQTAVVAQQYLFMKANEEGGLATILSPQEFAILTSVLHARIGLTSQAINRMRPWAAAVMTQYPPLTNDGIVLDNKLQAGARNIGKPLFGIETPQEQYEVFAKIQPAKQIIMLHDALTDLPQMDAINDDFLAAYKKHDLQKVYQLADDSFALTDDEELRHYIENALLYNRNRNMAQRLLPYLSKGNQFVAIGALHLMGDTGVLTLLEKEGYRIEVVR